MSSTKLDRIESKSPSTKSCRLNSIDFSWKQPHSVDTTWIKVHPVNSIAIHWIQLTQLYFNWNEMSSFEIKRVQFTSVRFNWTQQISCGIYQTQLTYIQCIRNNFDECEVTRVHWIQLNSTDIELINFEILEVTLNHVDSIETNSTQMDIIQFNRNCFNSIEINRIGTRAPASLKYPSDGLWKEAPWFEVSCARVANNVMKWISHTDGTVYITFIMIPVSIAMWTSDAQT